MQRYFVNHFENNRFYIAGDDRHHILHVMRMKKGDFLVCCREGCCAVCVIEEISSDHVVASVVKWKEDTAELPVHVTIASGLPKGDKLEWIIQKGTELGAGKFIPFAADRSIVKWDQKKTKKKVERWQKIAKEAAEQSGRSVIPQVAEPVSKIGLIEMSRHYDHRLVAYEEAGKSGESATLASILQSIRPGQSILAVFGPEGGLTEEEVHFFREHQFAVAGLGPRILRTETAPLYVLAAVSYQTELLR